MDKLLPIILIFLGEAITISVEVLAAKHFSGSQGSFASVFWKALPIFVFGCSLVVGGYMFGLARLKNIWVVSAVSITSILFIEPIVDYTLTGQIPTRGALIGLVFGVLGFAASLSL
jgi:hypothetical protein